MLDMRAPKPLRWWTHAILPLVFDESLSYVELLNKVVAKMNEVIGYVTTNIEELISDVVNEYFVKITYTESLEQINFMIERSENDG